MSILKTEFKGFVDGAFDQPLPADQKQQLMMAMVYGVAVGLEHRSNPAPIMSELDVFGREVERIAQLGGGAGKEN